MKIPIYSNLKAKLESKGLDSTTSGQIAWLSSSIIYALIFFAIISICLIFMNAFKGVLVISTFWAFIAVVLINILGLFNKYTFEFTIYALLETIILFVLLIMSQALYAILILAITLLISFINYIITKNNYTSLIFAAYLLMQCLVIILFFALFIVLLKNG